jgi:dolichyl-phosphate-mannose-protein mannosyltransferase
VKASRTAVLVAVVVILLASAAVRFYRIEWPKGYIFDEVYYAKDAKTIVDGRIGPKEGYQWMPGDEVSWPHPYYGKLAIVIGILLFGDNELGWRFMPALAGLATLLLVYPIARRLGLRREWALLALVFAAVDFLGIAQSRIATLDIFVGLFSVLTIYLALRYVQSGARFIWLALAGFAGGLAFGTKWSGAFACLASLVLILVLWRSRPAAQRAGPPAGQAATEADRGVTPGESWQAGTDEETERTIGYADIDGAPSGGRRARHRARNGGHRGTVAARSRIAAVLLPLVCLVLLPAALYFASYAFYFAAGHTLADWWQLQREMWTFSANLSATHTYASQAPTWILDIRPVWYHFKEIAGEYFGVVAMGHPLVWWAATLTLVTLPVVAILDRRRELALPSLIVALLYFPWFAASRTSFLYYMTPVAPFLAILLAAGLARLAGQPPDLKEVEAAQCRSDDTRHAHGETEYRGDAASAFSPDPPAIGAFDLNGRDPDIHRRWRHAANDRHDSGSLVACLAALICAAVVTALFWWPIGQSFAFIFYYLPATVAPVVGVAVASVVGAIALVALIYICTRPGFRPLWRYCAWGFAGICLGFTIVFAPIILDIPLTPDDFYRLMWLPSWI